MNLWRPSFLVFFAVTSEGLLTEPQEGSVAGGTWITVTLDDSASHELEHLSPASWPHLEVSLVNADLPTLPCDVSPVYFDLSIIRCRTRSSPQEGLYYVEVSFKGRVINNLTGVEKENYAFKFSALQTPVVYQISPPSGIPGNLIEIYGKTIAGRYETLDFNVDYIDGPAVLVAEGDGWTSLCSFADGQAGNIYSIQTKEGLGTMQCRVEGNHIGSHNVSFSVFNKGKSVIDKDAWLISAKQELFLYQTHSEIASVFPAAGSLAGGTDLTITGDFFEEPVQVTAAGVPCKVKRVSPRQIICTTEAVGRNRMLGAPQPGNRGLLFEVWDDASDLTEAGPGYRWQFVPSAQSPVRFLSAAKQSFSSRLRGFFVAPQTNNYTFWIQADGPASLYLSPSQDPQHKVRIAALPAGNLEWSGKWVKNWSESWRPKSQKFELTAGLRYYLEALHHGKAPSNGMRVGVQIHNTWLNPQVVNNYYIERHEIWARALYLPDVQMLTVSGTGWFSISWSNAPRRMIHTNSTALQVQAAIEELLSVGCDIEPTSAKILFRDGFEKQGTENSVTTERVVYGTEPFCGRFSARSPSQLVKASPSSLQRYDLTEYTHVCFAHKGHMSNVLHISVSYTNLSLSSVERNLTCQWDFDGSDTSWMFSCTDLWTGCVSRSVPLQDLLINTPVFVHQIDLLSIQQKETAGLFYLDEVIITDRAVTVSQRDPKPRRLGGRIIEAVTVVGSSPTYNVSWLVSGCGASLPLLSLRGAVLCEGSEEDGHLYVSTEDVRVSVTIQRLQVSSPPLGGTFCIRLGSTVISSVSVHISSHQLRRLLQTNTDSSTAPYFNTSDFIVTKDSETCYESIWTLTWRAKAGDLPNVINVSAENLSGLKPAVSSRVVYDGGVFIGPIFGDMLATSNNKTQVVVVVNDVPANCSGSCSFQFSQEVTPLVSDVEYSADDGFQATVVIRGVGFSEEKTTLQVRVKNTTCYIVMSDQTRVVCVMERLPLGVHQLTLLVRPYGFALNASTGEGIFLRVEPRLVAIEPPRASEIGGLRVALRGTGLEGVDLVLFGSQPCPVLEDTRSSTQIECKVPSRGAEDAAVHVTLVSGYQSTTFTNLFQYDPSLNPAIVSLSRNRSGLAGGQELQIGISSFANYRGSDIKVQIGGVWAQIQVQMDSGLSVTLPALAVGWYNVSVIINGVAIASNRVEPLIHYISEVFSIEPCCGSFLGGTLLTISGLGFSQNRSLVSVSVNEQTCLVTRLAEETIWCLTPPAANFSNEVSQDVPVRVMEMDAIHVFVGDSACRGVTITHLELQCSPPLLPAGEYPVVGLHVPKGWASSNLTFISQLMVTAVRCNWGGLNGGVVHLHGTGFSPGQTLVTICGSPCEMLGNATTTSLSCLAPRLQASLAFLCSLTHSSANCQEDRSTIIECDVQVMVGSYRQQGPGSYLYLCGQSQAQQQQGDTGPSQSCIAGLVASPKVERDEVLIYNSSCNITMETEAEMECEGANQPITAKITEIWKNWGQNTQPALQLCGRWAEASSWPAGRPPQDGANVTVEAGRTLLLGAATAVLHLLHLRGGKLVFTGPGPVELHAHYILISDGGELRVGSSTARFHHRARIYLYGSLHSPPLFPYGAKFLAVRNGTLSIHGWMPKVTFTYLKSSALANDLRLVLQKPVDWEPGDEIVVGRTGLGDAQQQEEVAVIESVNNTELYLRSPLRYSHNVGEERVNGQSLPLTAVVALLSRRVVVQGNVTKERISHIRECAEAGGTRGGSRCLYKRSERQLGSRDLGAVVIVEAFQGATSQLQVEGVQFYHMGQAFWQQRSALTVAGNAQMADSYIRGCCFLDSFGQGLHLTGISNLSVDSNVFFNISGHGLLLGSGLEKGNRIRNNVVIGLSATDGLSNIETLSPAGIYIRAPANHIEGNTVCAAGYGYFFHLSPEGPSKMPLLSFSENTAHSCTRHGLLVYPEYLPDSPNGPVQFDSFTVWSSQGGAQIFSSSNLKLQNFRIYACTDFGIDIIESLGNTAVANSVLVGHIGQKDNTCMSAGLKTPKRFQLFVSNTAFRNFDVSSCTAIRTCSGCYQGQGGFTVSLEHLTFTNSPFQVSFPFPHAAILEDLDGSVTGKEGSRILPSTDILAASCTTSANFSQALGGSVCSKDLVFHRMSLYLREAPETPYNLTVIDSRNKTTTVNYVPDTLSDLHGWMCLLLDKETYTLTFDSPSVSKQLQYSVTFSNFTTGNYLLVEHKDLPAQPEVVVSCGKRTGQPLQSLPSYGHHRSCDWYLDSTLRKLTYLVTGADLIQLELKEKEGAPSPTSDPSDSVLKWSHPETWKDVEKGWGGFNCSIPGPGEDVIILPNRTILVDTDLPPLRGLYILGTLEFPTNSSNVLSAACIVVVGGTLNVGSFQHPLERDSKLLILLRASEGIYCDHLEEINVHPGSIGVYGKVQIYSSYPGKSWTHLGASVAPGNERIMVEDEVDWRPEGDLVISSSSYEAHQAELVTLKEVSGHSITLHERLIHRHIGHPHDIEDGRSIPLSAEVGLLTRNIQIKSDVPCTGKILVGHFTDSRGREFEGVLQLLNIEFLNFGPPQLSAIEFRNVTQRSSVMSSSIHGSCGVGIKAVKSNGICLHDNIVFNTVGPGVDLEGKNHSLIRNLVILSRQPEGLLNWVAGIKVNLVIGVSLYGNVVAGSERIGFHIRGQECLLDVDYYGENVAHSNLHGIHLYRGDGFQTCTRITGFLSYKNYDYGLMFHLGSSVIIDSVVLVDNTVGLMPVIHCLYAKQCYTGKRLLELRNSTIVATSSTFDCIRDRIKPQAADLTSRDRPPYYLPRGRAGILWPKFTTVTSQRPDSPWHRIVCCPKVLGLMKLKDVTFTGFTKSCHGEDRDVCIMSDTDHSGIMPLITSERSRMLRVNEKDKFYFHAASSEDTTFPEKSCEGSRKALVKDLDGNLLDLEPPVSVFPKSEFEWTRFYLQSGIYRDDSKCVFKPSVQGYFCKQADYAFVILENLDSSMVKQELFPVVAVTGSFMDTFSDGASDASCRSAQHPSALFSVLPTTRLTTVCFPDLTPLIFRLYLLSGQNSTRLPLAIFYNEPLSLRVFTEGKYISPTLSSFSWNEGAGTNYFSFEDNLLYVLLHEEEPVQIVTGLSLHVAFTVTETTGEEGEANIMHQLADFLQVGHDQVRIVYRVPGGESMLEVISDNASKKKYHCPNMMFCTTFHSRSGSWGGGRAAVNARVVQSSDATGPSKVLIFEFGDPPGHQINEFQRSLTIDSLKILASAIINAHQTGDLQTVLGLPVDTIMVNQPDLLFSGRDNRSRQHLGTCLYVRPYSISVHVQPSDGETEKQLPVQPQIVFLDKKGRRIDTLGPPSEPWVVSAHLKGSSEAVLKGLTEVQVIGGCASFSNLAVSSSGTNWNLVFTVTSPPGAKFTVLSQPFTIFPVPVEEKASLILVVLMSAIASAFVITLVLCWFKKSKNNKTRTKRTDVPQASTKAPQKQAHPHAPHVQPCYDQRQNDNGVPVAGEVEETGAVRHEVGQGKELSPQLCEATPVRKANALQRKTSNRDIFSSARKGGNHQQPCGGTAPGGSVELQQASVLGCSAQKDVPQPPDGCNEERGNLDAVYSPQEEVREQIAMGTAAEGYQKSCQAVEQ
ncbi:fibrocystin isoform X6 [Centrocercus urophasianus]|uniref:fibrocystin isoform X6 n=1 Tax=Centrocercus urophasianus TaxID=9002 RepID=UPI001C646200|nr:fibrocystin isoform X6 [Centrocercus urophasianus]